MQRPRELTRTQLRELRLELDKQGFTDTALRTAWQQSKNEDIAASVIGFIRQAAIGDPLEPFEDRVHKAIRKIESRGTWTVPQRHGCGASASSLCKNWSSIAKLLTKSLSGPKVAITRLNKVFDGKLESLLADINEEIWKRAG